MLYPENATILAPLCGYTELPFRRECRRHGCHYAFTPLVEAGALIHAKEVNETTLRRGADEPWLGVQLLGQRPEDLERATRILFNSYNHFDVLDLNLGCPVPKVVKKGAGAAMGRNLEAAVRSIEGMVRASPIPVTAKTRIVSESDPEQTLRLAKALEAAGIQALTLHGRILEKRYAGPVFGDMIAAVRSQLRIPVIANGGIFNRHTHDELVAKTGCSRTMVARGSIGNPWIFAELAAPADLPSALPSHAEICATMVRHVHGMIELFGEEAGLRNSRKIILAYIGGRGYAAHLRAEVAYLKTMQDLAALFARIEAEGQSPDYLHNPLGRAARDIDFA